MELHQALIRNFNDYLAGKEVEAVIHLNENEIIAAGEKVLAIRDTVASTTDIPVPRAKFDQVIGVEGTVVETMREPIPGSRKVIVKIKKD